jgi:hypothetical protein
MLNHNVDSLNNKIKNNNKNKEKKIFINDIIEDKINKKIFINKDNKNNYSDDEELESKVFHSNKYIKDNYIFNINNEIINDEIINDEIINDENINDENIDDEIIQLEKLEKEFVIKSGNNSLLYPKNHGNIWNDKDRNKIIKYLLKNKFDKNYGIFDESNIFDIAKKLERTEYGIKEEIKKMIYNEYIKGLSYEKISENFNIPINNIKLIIKIYIEKNGKKIINQIEYENKILRLKVENIKLKKELYELNK